MKSLYETIKKYSRDKGEGIMWESVELISRAVDEHMAEPDKERLVTDVYGLMSGKHYNEEYAMQCVSKLFYTDDAGDPIYAPYWTAEQIRKYYDSAKAKIPEYNEWDYFVCFNMIASDSWTLYHSWWPEITEEQFAQKIADTTLAWLSDVDYEGASKIWCYMHMK